MLSLRLRYTKMHSANIETRYGAAPLSSEEMASVKRRVAESGVSNAE